MVFTVSRTGYRRVSGVLLASLDLLDLVCLCIPRRLNNITVTRVWADGPEVWPLRFVLTVRAQSKRWAALGGSLFAPHVYVMLNITSFSFLLPLLTHHHLRSPLMDRWHFSHFSSGLFLCFLTGFMGFFGAAWASCGIAERISLHIVHIHLHHSHLLWVITATFIPALWKASCTLMKTFNKIPINTLLSWMI